MKQHADTINNNERLWFYKRGAILLTTIVIGLIGITAIFVQFDADRRVAAYFYTPPQTWALTEAQPWKWLYEYGTIPGFALTIVGVVFWFFSWIKPQLAPWRRYILVVVLTSILGGGVIVNGILKDYWGRTRPRQIQEFEGRWQYLPIYQPGIPGKGKSFPCGHCTMAFLSVSAIFLYRQSKALALLGTTFGLIYGGLMSIARVGQGGHFPTDTFWALGIVLFTSTLLYYFLLKPPITVSIFSKKLTKKQAIGMAFGFLIAIALMVLLFLTRRPVFEDHKHGLSLEGMEKIQVSVNFDWQQITIQAGQSKSGSIQTIVRGLGLPNARNRVKIERTRGDDGVFYLNYELLSKGYFSELNFEVLLIVPPNLVENVTKIPQKK